MSHIPAWLYVLFGLLAVVAGVLGVVHAPTGVPTVFWATVTLLGLAGFVYAWNRHRQGTSS